MPNCSQNNLSKELIWPNFEANRLLKFRALLFPHPTQYNVENQTKLQLEVFNSIWGLWRLRQMKLYSRLACEQKHQKYKFVPKFLSTIIGSSRGWSERFYAFSVTFMDDVFQRQQPFQPRRLF